MIPKRQEEMDDQLPTQIIPDDRRLTSAEFQDLADVPPEIEWFANFTNRGTRRIYKIALRRGNRRPRTRSLAPRGLSGDARGSRT
jgi:hypothetical protein